MLFDGILNKAIEPLRWLIIVGIAYTLATTVWSFFTVPTTAVNMSKTPSKSISRSTGQAVNINWILAKHLFGEAGATPVEQDSHANEQAVQTQLPLELQSVFVADTIEESAAIVAQRGKLAKLYAIGDKLPGNASLVEVLTDRIILRRAGVREALMFPKTGTQFVADPNEDDAISSASRTANVPRDQINQSARSLDNDAAAERAAEQASLETYLDKIAHDAEGTLQELGIETVTEGTSTSGYRVGSEAAQNPYLRNTGLQTGDVILSVNGRAVGNIQQDQLELANIMAQGSARIEVQRGSRRFFITASLK